MTGNFTFLAYVDPGLGLLAWQALVAACVGTLFYLRKTRTWLAGFILKPFRSRKSSEPAAKPSVPTSSPGR
jgi:hypothetical protein